MQRNQLFKKLIRHETRRLVTVSKKVFRWALLFQRKLVHWYRVYNSGLNTFSNPTWYHPFLSRCPSFLFIGILKIMPGCYCQTDRNEFLTDYFVLYAITTYSFFSD
jgi:hypothetical protein